ncbi:MAG: DDE-type integrase/transposase/recombinase [Candidatus Sabulitectum sp.]|nr:DDE-type integrase/transposase/recombinase [Candidatus Sabulitectum sp.]
MVLDCFSRKIVGWAMSRNIDADLVCNSLRMAISSSGEASFWDLIHHSHRGSQYASEKPGGLIAAGDVRLRCFTTRSDCTKALITSHHWTLKGNLNRIYQEMNLWLKGLYSDCSL